MTLVQPATPARAKILVVDDIDANLFAMNRLLSRLDADLYLANSGNAALGLALDHDFAVILLDAHMPEMDGFEVAAILRESERAALTPIIFVTAAHTDELARRRGYGSGAVDYVAKPVDETILLSKLKIFLEMHAQRRQLSDALNEVHRQHELLNATLASIGDGVILTDAAGRVQWINPAAERLTGWQRTDAEGQGVDTVFNVVDAGQTPLVNPLLRALQQGTTVFLERDASLIRSDGVLLPVSDSAAPVRDRHGDIAGGVLVFQDASAARAKSSELKDLAETDALTGLVNRLGFERRLPELLASTREAGRQVAVLFCDLDAFKPVNDRLGHKAGDIVLQEIGRRLKQVTRAQDLSARWAGDEFVVAIPCDDRGDAVRLSNRLRAAVRASIDIAGSDCSVHVGISIGLAYAADHNWDPAVILPAADAALYRVKNRGGNDVQIAA